MFDQERQQVVTMRKLGMTYAEIAATLEIDRQGVYWLMDPRKEQARSLVKIAVRYGILKRPPRCEHCQKEPPKRRSKGAKTWKLAAHHEDYDKPVDVVWLCPYCHSAADVARRLREGKERAMPLIPGSACVVCGKEVQLSLGRPRKVCGKPCADIRHKEQIRKYSEAARIRAVIQGPAISEQRLEAYLDLMGQIDP
jgi:predicted nucleic acid-binding Zn ribbon protein